MVWWLWIAAGLVLAIVELLVPGYIFVGFAIGAVATGAILGLGLPGSAWMAADLTNALLVFGILSLVAWLSLRRLLGLRHGQVKRINRDINED
jgi:membrane protein implicated in regulation of membrane protease activity